MEFFLFKKSPFLEKSKKDSYPRVLCSCPPTYMNLSRCSLSWKCRTLLSESEGVRQSDPLSPTVGLRGPTVGLTVGPLSPTAGPWGPTGTPRCPGAQVPRCPGTQVPRYPGTQVPRYPGTQVPRYPGTQVPRYPGTQVQVQEQVPRNRKKVVKEQPQLHMTNTKVSSHVGHSCTEEIMIQQFTRKIT